MLNIWVKSHWILLVIGLIAVGATPEDPTLTFEQLYKYGKNEYSAGHWYDCVGFMRRALEDFNNYKDDTLWCRQKCGLVVEEADRVLQLSRMFRNAQTALCLLRCREEKFTERRPPLSNYEVYQDFLDRKPWHYMQLCYWKMNDLENALKAAYTYLVAHPEDEDALENVKFYMEQPGFKQDMLVDALQRPYEKHYMTAFAAYSNGEWERCAAGFRRAYQAFLQEVRDCRAGCEDQLDWSWLRGDNPELSVVVASIHSSVLRCQHRCPQQLSVVNGQRLAHLVALCFQHLHLCQFHANQGVAAAQSVQTALLLDPKNVMMRRNKLFYMKHYGQIDIFEPIPEIVEFHTRQELERRFLDFVDNRFKYVDGMLTPESVMDRKAFDTTVPLEDTFDYSRLEVPLLNESECKALESAAQIPAVVSYAPALAKELLDRIVANYGESPEIKMMGCTKEKMKSGCKHQAFVVGLEPERCGAVLTDQFDGCAIVFCLDH